MSRAHAASSVVDAASLRAAREIAYDEFKKTQSVGKLTKQLSKLSDQLLSHLWNSCGLNNEATLVAVGGFGRGALFPYSDIDILILLPADEVQARSLSKQVEQFVATVGIRD
jgi:[protein-PII] uridylyltransferase